MNYHYTIDQDMTFAIYEDQTEQIIKYGMSKEAARSMTRKLNFGAGFDGNTPKFFLNTFKVKI